MGARLHETKTYDVTGRGLPSSRAVLMVTESASVSSGKGSAHGEARTAACADRTTPDMASRSLRARCSLVWKEGRKDR